MYTTIEMLACRGKALGSLLLASVMAVVFSASSQADGTVPAADFSRVSRDSLARTIRALERIGTRFSGTSGSDLAAAYLEGRLRAMGVETHVDTIRYLSGTLKRTFNVVGTIGGVSRAKVILGAHYDSISRFSYVDSTSLAPGADDNGSGCAALLEAARLLSGDRYANTIEVVFFGGEEVGRIGSRHHASEASAAGDSIVAMICLDAIGYDADEIPDVDILTDDRSVGIAERALAVYRARAPSIEPSLLVDPFWTKSDHSSFWQEGHPAIHLYEGRDDPSPYYHTEGDTLGTVNLDFLALNTLVATTLVADLAVLRETTPAVTLFASRPNPFSESITIPYWVARESKITIDVLDVLGRRVARLFSGYLEPGESTAVWNGRANGTPVPSGVYFVAFSWRGGKKSIKVILIR